MLFEQAQKLMNFLQDNGYEANLYENYSGRYMYGRTTTGVTTDANPGAIEYMEEDMKNADIDSDFSRDSMGLDYIYY